ncbi:hypothetical protein ACFSO7_02975 [Bacillus sp. CGMCC 1.16607]|uniref:hypothetical protein n=1 Tax=Bacillus sp. CGMCC 1.16607 TaxID=3351842 RepID=UPI003638F404
MERLKISNLIQKDGNPDYKGLNIDLFVGGQLLYSNDFSIENLAYVTTKEDTIPRHKDIQIVTEEEFLAYKETLNVSRPKSEIEILKETVGQLETQQGDLLMEIALLKMGGSF